MSAKRMKRIMLHTHAHKHIKRPTCHANVCIGIIALKKKAARKITSLTFARSSPRRASERPNTSDFKEKTQTDGDVEDESGQKQLIFLPY